MTMSKAIIYENETGGVSVVYPAPQARQRVLVSEDDPDVYRDQTDEEFLAFVASTSVPEGVPYQVIDLADIPQDRTFRSAWKADGARIVEDVEKAKAVAKDILRAQRAPLLEALDVQFMQALERGQDPAPIVAEKQRLRDITNLPDAAASVAELRQIAASALGAEEAKA